MTYDVFGGTLNLALSILVGVAVAHYTSICHFQTKIKICGGGVLVARYDIPDLCGNLAGRVDPTTSTQCTVPNIYVHVSHPLSVSCHSTHQKLVLVQHLACLITVAPCLNCSHYQFLL